MDQYKKPKGLKVRRVGKQKVKKAESMSSPKMTEKKGLKLKRASVDVTMSKPEGKITVIKKKSKPVLDTAKDMKGYRRVDLESQTEGMMKNAMREAMEKKRLERAKKEREMIRRIK